MAAATHAWAFRPSLRRNASGWSGRRKAIERLNEAVGEIERVARTDSALAGKGAVLLLEKLSPAVNQIDSRQLRAGQRGQRRCRKDALHTGTTTLEFSARESAGGSSTPRDAAVQSGPTLAIATLNSQIAALTALADALRKKGVAAVVAKIKDAIAH